MRVFILSLLAGLILTLATVYLYQAIYPSPDFLFPPDPPPPVTSSMSPVPTKPMFSPPRMQKTIALEKPGNEKSSGLTSSAISSFFAPWFQTITSVDPAARIRENILLNGLINDPEIAPMISAPETYALLTLTDSSRDLAMFLAANQEDYRPATDILLSHATPTGVRIFSDILARNPALINELHSRGLIGSEVIFAYDHTTEAGREYNRWQREVLQQAVKQSPEQLASLINLQLLHGEEIRTRMKDSPRFLTRFRRELWPIMTRIAAEHRKMYEIFLDTPKIWDLLMLAEGEQLIKSKGPLVPIDLIYGFAAIGHNPYPKAMRPDIIRTLLSCDETTVRALMKFRREAAFANLVKRNLPPELLSAISRKLLQAGADYPRLLKDFSQMNDTGLSEEIGPPPSIVKIWTPLYFTLWEVPRKLAHGRKPKVMEWIASIADPASFLMPVVKIGTAGINLVKSFTGKQRAPAKRGKGLKERGRELADQELGQNLSHALSDRQLYSFNLTAMLIRMLKEQKTIKADTITDRSGAIRFFLAYSGADPDGLRLIDHYRLRFLYKKAKPMQIVPERNLKQPIIDFFRDNARACLDHGNARACGRNRAGWWLLMAGGISMDDSDSGVIPQKMLKLTAS